VHLCIFVLFSPFVLKVPLNTNKPADFYLPTYRPTCLYLPTLSRASLCQKLSDHNFVDKNATYNTFILIAITD